MATFYPSARMTIYKRFSPNLISGFWIVMMIAIWLVFAPAQAGGMASYIIVIGNSMEPNFHIGDLIIVHEEAVYQVGDAVVYRNLELGSFVFHRIIEQEMGRFTLQGDNNSWTDTYQPSSEEVLGKLWLHIPKGGNAMQKIRNPVTMAVIAGVLGCILALGFFTGKSKGRKRMNKEWFASIKQKIQGSFTRLEGSEPHKSSNPNQGNLLEGSVFALGLVAFASLILGIISFSRPATRPTQNDISYEHLGFFAYTASAPSGIYDSNAIQSGDPIFPKVTCSVDMTFQYTLVAGQAENVTGTYQLTATISEQASGWQRVVPLQDETTFSGNAVGTTAKLDLCKMERLTQSMEQGTDFHPGSYTLTVSPNIKVDGVLSGSVLKSTFNPGLAFKYDRVHFYLVKDEEQTGNVLNISESGALRQQKTEANTIKIFSREFAIPALRLTAIIGLLGSLGGLLLLGTRLQNLSKSDPAQFIRTRFDSMMIDVQNADVVDSKTTIDVSSIDHLGKLAERFNALILHTEFSQSHAYYVQGEGTTYRFVLSSQKTGSAIPENEAKSQGGES
jgi:signal peptidase I